MSFSFPPKTLGHSAKARFVVITTERRWCRALMALKRISRRRDRRARSGRSCCPTMMGMKTIFLVAILGLALGMACSSSSLPDGQQGTGGAGGVGGAGGACEYIRYFSPGCAVTPVCADGAGGACATFACGCNGKITVGCNNEFREPYAYTYTGIFKGDGGGPVGMTCDPTADGGRFGD